MCIKPYFSKSRFARRNGFLPMRAAMIACLFLLVIGGALAQGGGQTITVTGVVRDAGDNSPVSGATVLVKGTTVGVMTDENGGFTIGNVASSAVLRVSLVGMEDAEVTAAPAVTVVLRADVRQLDEVMVVAYGTTKKSSYTGAASLVKSDKFEERPLTSVTSALLGATPGVQVSSANGQPGSESNIYIRGIGSISGSNTPLIILDGMPYDNGINTINPSDIESMTVLKDASSAALYGARAANGVVVITTKTGKKDRMSVNVKINRGFTARQSTDYDKVSTDEYVVLYWEKLRNSNMFSNKQDEATASRNAAENLFGTFKYNPYNVPDNEVIDAEGRLNPNAKFMWGDDTDWNSAVQQIGKRTDGTVSISGGTAKSDYYASVGYLNESGYIIGSKFERYTLSANVNSQISKFLKTGVSLAGNIGKSDGNQDESQGNISNPFRFTRYIGPIYPIHLHDPVTKDYVRDAAGNLIYDFGNGPTLNGINLPGRDYNPASNPAKELQDRFNGYEQNNMKAKAYADVSFLDGFKFSANASVVTNNRRTSTAAIVYPEKGNTGDARKTNTASSTWIFNQLLSYDKDFGVHHIDVLAGHESYDYKYEYLSVAMKDQKNSTGTNYELANYSNINTPAPTSYSNVYRTEGYLSRVNYSYDNRYFLSASFRRDASSLFAPETRWGNFWSIGGSWLIDKEAFMSRLEFVNLLKLRASYGEIGSDNISSSAGYYPWRAVYEQAQNASEAGYIQSSLGNAALQWEVSRNYDIALEFGLWKNRLSGSVEFFDRRSSNLLYNQPLSPSTGTDAMWNNAGDMYNRGVEADINGVVLHVGDFKWNLGVNATFLKNQITSLPLEPYVSGIHKIEPGHSRYEYWLRQWAGVYDKTGECIYLPNEKALTEGSDYMVTMDGQQYTTNINEALYDYSGTATPKVTGGISTSASWKGITLSLMFYWQLGGKMYDVAYSNLMSPGKGTLTYSTMHKDILGRWRKEGDRTDVPRIESENANIEAGTSTRWLVSSDMLELTNVNLSYDFPKKWLDKIYVAGLRVYVSSDNTFLFTARKGIYPRRNILSGYSSNGDVYLPARVFTMGLNLTF